MHKPLSGKTALVTGGSRGIGAAIARKLAAQGADVALTYAASDAKAQAVVDSILQNGARASAIHGDAVRPETMPAVVAAATAAFGPIDILVNNAGVFEGIGQMVGEVPDEAFERVLNINLRSAFAMTQAATETMPDGGRIIMIGSVLGSRAIFAGASAYAMSKAAVSSLARSWAWDLAPRAITANAVEPGPIRTGMGDPDAAGLTALKRLGEPEEVAAVVAFLAGPEASYVTGATIRVDGGVNA